jgi:hypothetical protein
MVDGIWHNSWISHGSGTEDSSLSECDAVSVFVDVSKTRSAFVWVSSGPRIVDYWKLKVEALGPS